MNLDNLKPTPGCTHYKKVVGRGTGCGLGKTSGRGQKGQNSRSGGGVRLGFEGGQTPLFKRLPKRGFTNFSRKEFAIVNVSDLNSFAEGTVVNPEALLKKGLIKEIKSGLKVLGNGELTVKVTVQAHKITDSARGKIEALGGTVEVI